MSDPYPNGRLTSKYGIRLPNGRHHFGTDHLLPNRVVTAAATGKIIASGTSWGYRKVRNRLVRTRDGYVVQRSGPFYLVYWHLDPKTLPKRGETRNQGAYLAHHTFTLHFAVFRASGPLNTITNMENWGWAVDPFSVNWGGDSDMIDKKYLKNNLYRPLDGDGTVYLALHRDVYVNNLGRPDDLVQDENPFIPQARFERINRLIQEAKGRLQQAQKVIKND